MDERRKRNLSTKHYIRSTSVRLCQAHTRCRLNLVEELSPGFPPRLLRLHNDILLDPPDEAHTRYRSAIWQLQLAACNSTNFAVRDTCASLFAKASIASTSRMSQTEDRHFSDSFRYMIHNAKLFSSLLTPFLTPLSLVRTLVSMHAVHIMPTLQLSGMTMVVSAVIRLRPLVANSLSPRHLRAHICIKAMCANEWHSPDPHHMAIFTNLVSICMYTSLLQCLKNAVFAKSLLYCGPRHKCINVCAQYYSISISTKHGSDNLGFL